MRLRTKILRFVAATSSHLRSVATLTLLGLAASASAQESMADVAAGEATIPTKNLLDVFYDGGPLMYPIGLSSFVLMIFVFERFISLRRGRVIPKPFVKRFIEQLREGQLDREKAVALCEQNKSPVAVVFAAAAKKWGRTAVEVEQAILDSGERVTNQLRRHLRLLNGISQVSPLLGLLGTVLGMISSFNAIATAEASGQREALAGGIAEALITTAAGMLVAIPALIAYLYFVGRVDQHITEIDMLGQQVVELISSDALEQSSRAARKERAKAAA
ncbi:MotA/TolQ/ExbB proton channel [Pirellula staleyi DSM 6068]|uniref:MotA/TolQ/ExbB proton channel n=1 Tax=Pirellula staleyi (strain ATCC 27377 / DSM 6068 / ICPB 4128) TaxID=530564 RepID=D2R4R8_PIRSD|nr:MotA/TolQ/ExbB proton channel family protein [Pirellula staleyi]ADB17134.1 MotA/TolQ/ExbB proton channel [Pirellula staleyi DSM 6068]